MENNVGMNVDNFLELQKRYRDLEKKQKDMPDGFNKIIDDNFFDLIQKQTDMIFQNGTFTTSSVEEKLQLSFSPLNDNYWLYDLVYKSLPEKKGLKRKRNRMLFAMELVDNILKNNPGINNTILVQEIK